MKRILLILSVFLLLPCIAGAAVPTLVQHVAVNGINEPYKYTSIKIPLPNLTLSNNAVIARFFCDAGVTVTVGVVGFWLVFPSPWLPPPHAPIERAITKRRRTKISPANRFTQTPFVL